MKVLITGGAGFIGSHLAERLHARGETVIVIDDLSTGSLENIASLHGQERFQFVRDSVRNAVTMTSLVDRCDLLFHLAAAVGVRLIAENPVQTIETNIHGSEVVLELANKFARRTLIASTSEVYGKSTKVPFGEDDDSTFGSTRFSRWCYACSKMVDEFLALAYHEQFGLETVVTRLFNTIGPRQTGQYGMVVPRFVRRALAGEPLEICGDGQQSRCFSNVADTVDGLIALAECDQAIGQIINLGTTESISIEDLARKVVAMTGSKSELRRVSYEDFYGRPFDDMLIRQPDLSKAERLIGYKPKYTLEQTLQQIIDYERSKD